MSGARVERFRAASGNRDADYWHGVCGGCGWDGAYHSNRTVEGRALAARDAVQHRCPRPAEAAVVDGER